MAKYTITHACGHTEEVNLFGKHSDRERKIAYLESIDCRACWDAAQAAQAKEAGLPDLTGSPKQIAWANGIRNRILAEATRCIETHPDWPDTARWLAELKKETSARWWIDHLDAHAASMHGDWALAQEAKILKCVVSFINANNQASGPSASSHAILHFPRKWLPADSRNQFHLLKDNSWL